MRRMALRAYGVFSDCLLVCSHRCRLAVAAFAFLGLTLLGPAAPRAWVQAQAFSASLRGLVYDNSGAIVPAATVTLSNPEKAYNLALKQSEALRKEQDRRAQETVRAVD